MSLRADLEIIQQWIRPGSRVLDLGCGEGQLLRHLRDHKQVQGYGLEIDPDKISSCIRHGVNVMEQNLDESLDNFEDNSFDTVVMTQSLQAMHYPDRVLEDMLRIGHDCIVTFPNFAHWRLRLKIALWGTMPASRALPNRWYNTPNIHLCTVHDFEALCREKNADIVRRHFVNHAHRAQAAMRLLPNVLGEIALYQLRDTP